MTLYATSERLSFAGEFVNILITSSGKKIEFSWFDNQNEESLEIVKDIWYFFCLVVNVDWLVTVSEYKTSLMTCIAT